MSGFGGIYDAEREASVDRSALEIMVNAIAHRSEGESTVHAGAGFGIAAVGRTYETEDGSLRVALDGSIVNRKALGDRLTSLGHVVRPGNEMEILLEAYREWGADCVHHLRGPFAFAIWDSKERALLLCRDHSGVRPLYVAVGPTRTVFASEVKALLTDPSLRRGIDLLGYLGGIEFDAHLRKSPFLGIMELSPGCILRCTASRRATSRYWSWHPNREPGRFSPMSVAGEFAERLHEAVGLHVGPDERFGLCLSGGVNSAALAASLALHERRDVMTYTFESEGDSSRDGLAAQVVSEHLRLENRRIGRPVTAAPDDDEIFRMAWLAEGEFSPAFGERVEIAKAARADGVAVLLNGQGIDAVIGGNWATYHAFRNAALAIHLRAEVVPSARGWPRFSPAVIGAVGQDLSGFMGRRLVGWGGEVMSRELGRGHARLSNGALRFEDRTCAAHGVEARSPFLDHSLLDFLASLPEGSRLEMFTSKRVLRAAAARVLPRNIAGRPPAASPAWSTAMSPGVIERDGPLSSLLARERVEETGWFSWADVESMKASGDHAALDHVLILHLLDEIFIRDFRAGR